MQKKEPHASESYFGNNVVEFLVICLASQCIRCVRLLARVWYILCSCCSSCRNNVANFLFATIIFFLAAPNLMCKVVDLCALELLTTENNKKKWTSARSFIAAVFTIVVVTVVVVIVVLFFLFYVYYDKLYAPVCFFFKPLSLPLLTSFLKFSILKFVVCIKSQHSKIYSELVVYTCTSSTQFKFYLVDKRNKMNKIKNIWRAAHIRNGESHIWIDAKMNVYWKKWNKYANK